MWLTIPDWQIAGGFALLASMTFPVGAMCGALSCDRRRKMSDEVLSFFLAIGAGSLIFAVAVEVYAEGLDAIEYVQPGYPIRTAAYIVQVLFAVAGALMYIELERSVRNRSIPLWHVRGWTTQPLATPRAVGATSVIVSDPTTGNGSLEDATNSSTRERGAWDSDADTEAGARVCTAATSSNWATREEDHERERLLRDVCEEPPENTQRHRSDATTEEEEEAVTQLLSQTEEHVHKSPVDIKGPREALQEQGRARGAAAASTSVGITRNEAAARNFLKAIFVCIQRSTPMLERRYCRLACSRSQWGLHSSGAAAAAHYPAERESDQQSPRIGQHAADNSKDYGRSANNLDLALVLWTSQLLDALPEAMMIGFRTAGDTLSWAFIVALCISNFPESFCGGYIMRKEGLSTCATFMCWFAVSCFTAVVSVCTVILTPSHASSFLRLFDAAVQGIAAGAMLALATASMLPAAYEARGVTSGLYCVMGFLLSLSTRLLFGLLNGPAPLGEEGGTVIHASHNPAGTERAVAGVVV